MRECARAISYLCRLIVASMEFKDNYAPERINKIIDCLYEVTLLKEYYSVAVPFLSLIRFNYVFLMSIIKEKVIVLLTAWQ